MAQQSPMPVKFRVMFFMIALSVMTCFALVAVSFSERQYTLSVIFLLLAFLLVGIGFMARKKILLRILGPKPKQ